ncbi:hypothetical protein S40288_10771 [Stachybotrys chartarum IBT 40288]|nr:hypothetical protein S40288_10771 [Stachybotrys chartarum IBT 40288]
MGLPLFGTPEYETHEEAVAHAAEKKKALAKAENDLAELKAYLSAVTEELFDASAWVDEHAKRYLEYLNRKAYFVSKAVEGFVRLRSMITRVKAETVDVARTDEWTCQIAQATLQLARLKLKYLRH